MTGAVGKALENRVMGIKGTGGKGNRGYNLWKDHLGKCIIHTMVRKKMIHLHRFLKRCS